MVQDPPRAPIIQSVDLSVPFAPVTFDQGARLQLAYEIHVTNFQPGDVTLASASVYTPAGETLAAYRGDDLRRRIVRPGLRHDHPTPDVVGAGGRAVVLFWFELPPGTGAPGSVTHTVELDVARPGGAMRTVVTGGAAPVSTRAVALLDAPLAGGPWVAIYDPLLKGGHRTAFYTVDGRARIPGRFAIDFIALPPAGAKLDDLAGRPANWNGAGSEVLAVADGTVAGARDDTPDATPKPVPLEHASGNYVALDLGGGRIAFYEHLQRGSVRVAAGETVRRGQLIGRLGSSGSSSIGPHLHFHLADAHSLLGAEGIPFAFRQFEHMGHFASIDSLIGGESWSKTASRSSADERPMPNAVIQFP